MSKAIRELLWFCITSLSDWFKVLAPFFQPITGETKTKTNRGSRVHIFPRFVSAVCNYFRVRIGLLDCLHPFWLAQVITLVLVLRHSVETRSIVLIKILYLIQKSRNLIWILLLLFALCLCYRWGRSFITWWWTFRLFRKRIKMAIILKITRSYCKVTFTAENGELQDLRASLHRTPSWNEN